jgi:hypothetical protein
MIAHWHYKKTEPFLPQGKDTTRPNFSREERSEVGILIREGLQNPLDARRDDFAGAVCVTLRNLDPGSFDVDYLDEVFTREFRERLKVASGVDLPPAEGSYVFVIEDFGTKGLLGDVENYNADGDDQNWNAFWHREGEGAKGQASNGGAGQGKVTYFAHSHASVVLGLTVRSNDMRRLMMGRAAFLRDYKFSDGLKYVRQAYFTTSDSVPAPESGAAELDRFSKAFALARDPLSPGLSLVVPFAKPFEAREAIASVILDFYMPIAAGRLEVAVGETRITSKTIDPIADRFISDQEVINAASSFTKAYRAFARSIITNSKTHVTLRAGWNKDRIIPESVFSEGDLAKLRASLESGARVAIKLPLMLKRKSGMVLNTTFDVFIETPADLNRNEEAFVRRDLLIGAESHVTAGSFIQKTRSMTWIQDCDLSDFLLAAEEPTHLKWNASLARDKGDYVTPDHALRSIRQAVPRLLAVLLSGNAKKDFKSLARFFSRPATGPSLKLGGGRAKKNDVSNPSSEPPPPPRRKPIRIESMGATIRVVPNGTSAIQDAQLPIKAVLELAYEGLDQDPFVAYDPYDFDITQVDVYPVDAQGLTITRRSGNQIEVNITDADFRFEIGGFDPNVRMRARLSYNILGLDVDEREDDGDG